MPDSPTEKNEQPFPKILYLNFVGAINDNSVRSAIDTCSKILSNDKKPETIYLFMSSQGGAIDPGITLYNFLRSLPIELIIHNNGTIDSIANVVFLAANKRYASLKSSFLFHRASWTFPSGSINGVTVTRTDLCEALDSLATGEDLMCKIISDRTTLTTDQIAAMFLEGGKKTPEFALSNGIIQEIKDFTLPKDAKVYTIPAG